MNAYWMELFSPRPSSFGEEREERRRASGTALLTVERVHLKEAANLLLPGPIPLLCIHRAIPFKSRN